MDRYEVMLILTDLEIDIQDLRENGETDLRTVLHLVSTAIANIQSLN